MNVINLHQYKQNKIDEYRIEMQRLLLESRIMTDEAVNSNDYSKIIKSRKLLDEALLVHTKIKTLTKKIA